MFQNDKFYKHNAFLDMCFKVLKVQYRGSNKIKLKISWYFKRNMNALGLSESIIVDTKDFSKYKEVTV